MDNKIRFDKKDIGAELLSILTTGLYRDTLDTLREYVQNGIDAGANQMSIKITPDTITIEDDGRGMDEDTARNAIRLGISDKNPHMCVGFRGIGIYSAFNLCNLVEIYTRANTDGERKIIFDFKNIRHELTKDHERRKAGLPTELYLEKVLRDSVYLQPSGDKVISGPTGTKIFFSGLLDEVYQRLNSREEVTSYLQDVVPLPFREDFKYKQVIEQKLRESGDKVVAISLALGPEEGPIFRPYHDGMFTNRGMYEPKFFTMDPFGFAWVCINDSRTVLEDTKLRGLLIKKFGFSVASRSFLEPFFSRVVFNRRITGELIVQNESLIPNAARSDFEHNLARESFMKSLPKFIKAISKWANEIQEEEKAKEVLSHVHERLIEINQSLPRSRRDINEMLGFNVKLAQLKDELKVHEKKLDKIASSKLRETQSILHECVAFVNAQLAASRSSREAVRDRLARSIAAARGARKEDKGDAEKFESLATLLESFGINLESDIKEIISFIDNSILKEYLDTTQYQESLRQLKDYLGEKL